MEKHYCVISHTHWDREWYLPFQVCRLRLVDLIDHLLDDLDRDPEFIFHLDAQTVVLDDYLAIRENNRERLETHIRSGRLIVGPWYVQNDFYLTSGEATVRNLLTGIARAESFGRCERYGYAPDQFGIIPQLPQILNGFKITDFVSGRGRTVMEYGEDGKIYRAPMPCEFIWEGSDGSRLFGVYMIYFYNNAQRFSENIDTAMVHIEVADRGFKTLAKTPYYLLMNGVDHLEAQGNLLPILKQMNERMETGKIYQDRLSEYTKRVQAYVEENNIPLDVVKGELRHGPDEGILKGTLSSRVYLKQLNVAAQDMLENRLEPLYSMLELSGCTGVYSLDHMKYLWRELIKNHPHDSICGCSVDEVHKNMENSYLNLRLASEELLERGMRIASEHTVIPGAQMSDYMLTVANTVGIAREALVTAELDFFETDKVTSFEILDNTGTTVDFEVLSVKVCNRDIFSPLNLPGYQPVTRYEVRFRTHRMPPLSFATYLVRPHTEGAVSVAARVTETPQFLTFGTKQLQFTILDGRIDIHNHLTGKTVQNALYFEECGDNRDSYRFNRVGEDRILDRAYRTEIVEWNDAVKAVKLYYHLDAPEYYDFDRKTRSESYVANETELTVKVSADSDIAELSYRMDNRSSDHRVRLTVATGLISEASVADAPFDLLYRTRGDFTPGATHFVFPNSSFCGIEADGCGMAVVTSGQQAYEHVAEKGTLAVTLVRGTGVVQRHVRTWTVEGGDHWVCPENQCLRVLEGRLGLVAYKGKAAEAGIPAAAKAFLNPPLVFYNSCNPKKFVGGRTAVQDTKLTEFFYLPDPYPQAVLKENKAYVEVSSKELLLTAFKKAENGQGLIVRYVNLSDSEVKTELRAEGCSIALSSLDEADRTPLGKDRVAVTFGPKKILTFLLTDE